jgi:hypothetical protein
MEAYLFFYSRLERFDYRLIYAPSKSFLPDPIRSEFITFAREVINTDNVSNGKISVPRWSIIRRENLVLYGIGVYNKELGDCYSEFENRDIRGYFGVVFNYDNGNLPLEYFSLAYFRDLYSQYFAPFWHAKKTDEKKINSIVQKIDINIEAEGTSSRIELNGDYSICKVIPEPIVVKDVVNTAIGLQDIELVLGLNDIKHVTTASLLKFRNISILGNTIEKSVPIACDKVKSDFSKNEDSASLIPKQTIGRVSKSVSNKQHNRKAEVVEEGKESEYEYLADTIYHKLRKCGINVKSIVRYLAKKCGLRIVEPSFSNYHEPVSSKEEVENDSYNYDAEANAPEILKTSKIERRNRLSEIRKKMSTSEHVSEMTGSETTQASQNTDFNNLEELNNLSLQKKDNLSIEDI